MPNFDINKLAENEDVENLIVREIPIAINKASFFFKKKLIILTV